MEFNIIREEFRSHLLLITEKVVFCQLTRCYQNPFWGKTDAEILKEFWLEFQSKKQSTFPILFTYSDQNSEKFEKEADFMNSLYLPTIKCSGVFPSLSLFCTSIPASIKSLEVFEQGNLTTSLIWKSLIAVSESTAKWINVRPVFQDLGLT